MFASRSLLLIFVVVELFVQGAQPTTLGKQRPIDAWPFSHCIRVPVRAPSDIHSCLLCEPNARSQIKSKNSTPAISSGVKCAVKFKVSVIARSGGIHTLHMGLEEKKWLSRR